MVGPLDDFAEAFPLAERIEDDMIGQFGDLLDLVLLERGRIDVDFTAGEFLGAQPGFEDARCGDAVERVDHLVEDTPRGEAFQCQQELRAGPILNVTQYPHVPPEQCTVDDEAGGRNIQGGVIERRLH